MPLGRIYVPPPLINSGSPSPASGPSSLLSPSSNGIGDLRSKWENHQNTNSHHQQHTTNNNNGFRQIEIKVDVKKDKINKRSKYRKYSLYILKVSDRLHSNYAYLGIKVPRHVEFFLIMLT